MNVIDITNALQFLPLIDHIILVVPRREDVPLTKRELHHVVGQPRKTIGDILYYGTKSIQVISLTRGRSINYVDIWEKNGDSMFYIGWKDGGEESILKDVDVNIITYPERSIELWKYLRMPVENMLKALQVDGYTEEESVEILDTCNLL